MTRNRTILAALAAGLVLTLAAGSCDSPDTTQAQGQRVTEEYAQAATQAVPYPMAEMKAGGWLERRNVRERNVRYANPNKLSYIYLFSDQGQLIANYPIKGKVSNASSQLTPDQTVRGYCSTCYEPVNAPMDDGTWGPGEDAIFFYTTEGVMVQWNGPYVLADAPLNLTSKPLLVYSTSSKPTSVGDKGAYGG
jgi:hypothetical protein